MDAKALQQLKRSGAAERTAQWQKVEALLATGKLKKVPGAYQCANEGIAKQLNRITTGVRVSKDGVILKMRKPGRGRS